MDNPRIFEKAINALDSDGITEDFYNFILSVVPDREANLLRAMVDSTDGMFYLEESDAFEIRNDYGFDTDWSPTNDL